MGTGVVEVIAPRRHQIAGMVQVIEQVLIQVFVPHPAIEAFDKAVLHRFARRNVMPFNFAIFLPFQHRIGCQFRAVVLDHHAGVHAPVADSQTVHQFQQKLFADTVRTRLNITDDFPSSSADKLL